MKNQSRHENLTYLIVWGLLFLAPLLSLYVRTMSDEDATFNWTEVLIVWRSFAIFLILFLLHNCFLAPLIVHQQRRVLYFSIVGAVLVAVFAWQCTHRPQRKMRAHDRLHMEKREPRPPHFEEGDMPEPPFGEPPTEKPSEKPHERPHFKPHDKFEHRPPVFVGQHDILVMVVLLLMFGANLGIKYYFRSRNDQKRLAELERQNLEQQLEYLRYQINPHFFMNTLNNIHALVDIDPAKAQETIVELSKMMRFVLYEGDKRGVPLAREIEFIRTYLKLMQLRFTDQVKISQSLPSEVPDKKIPPLLLITFVENAFKHGVSYQQESFIELQAAVEDDRLIFSCRNSKASKPNQEKGGVGLTNVRKRLDLLYSNDYSLDIHDEADSYAVKLNIPLS